MSYVDTTLLPGEKVVLKGQIHWIVFVSPILTFLLAFFVYYSLNQGLVALVIALMGLIGLIKGAIYFFTTELAVTDKRVISKFGLIKRDTSELNVNRVTSLNVDQSVLGRLLNYGDITVVGMGGSATPIPAIVDPLRFRRVMLGEVEGTKIDN